MKVRVGIAVAIIGSGALFIACSEAQKENFRDAGISGRNDAPARVVTFPDGFSNVAAKCDGPNMVYSAFRTNGRAVAVVPNDPRCSADG